MSPQGSSEARERSKGEHTGGFSTEMHDPMLMLVIPLSALLAAIQSQEEQLKCTTNQPSDAQLHVPWDQWGPRNCRLFSSSGHLAARHANHGCRLIVDYRAGMDEREGVQVLDFNAQRVRSALRQKDEIVLYHNRTSRLTIRQQPASHRREDR